jgi:hypothetical protein
VFADKALRPLSSLLASCRPLCETGVSTSCHFRQRNRPRRGSRLQAAKVGARDLGPFRRCCVSPIAELPPAAKRCATAVLQIQASPNKPLQ